MIFISKVLSVGLAQTPVRSPKTSFGKGMQTRIYTCTHTHARKEKLNLNHSPKDPLAYFS